MGDEMTWLNRGFKIRHKFTKEKEMKEEAIKALEQFKQQHLARKVEDAIQDIVSPSHSVPQPTEETMEQPRKQKGVNFNYPDHIAPLKQRIMSALNNGARSVESVARYAKEGEKLINLQLNLMVSRGLIGKHIVPSSGNVKYYPAEMAKEMGILKPAQPINRKPKGKKVKPTTKATTKPEADPRQLDLFKDTPAPKVWGYAPTRTQAQEPQYIAFLEKRIVEWQTEARKMAKLIATLENQVVEAHGEIVKAKTEPRNVTGEVQEVMKEVMELRATIAYLESKLFGRK